MKQKREYALRVGVNNKTYHRVIIDSHYEKRHRNSVTDALILELVGKLDNGVFLPHVVLSSGYAIFVNDPWHFEGKAYRLIWTTHNEKDYIGVINAFRRRK